uniref:G_PROTEIN_RECEP_F1_2 domain-containing protein n=1 Tax=Steinernema glaseri TaxID=37863 RepID=A0A1I7Y518_9BILA
MALLCVVTLWAKYADDLLAKISLLVKLVSFVAFCITAPNFLRFHQSFITSWGCHGYVPEMEALNEYFMFLAYLLFHSSKLIDIRSVRFICFPRTCSGECEPVVPANFAKGGKFEHCRSYELRQRQLLGL